MRRPLAVPLAVLLWTMSSLGTAPHAAGAAQTPVRPAPPADTAYQAVLDRYCVTCHNERAEDRRA